MPFSYPEEDADSGDISLSFPHSRSSPQISSLLNSRPTSGLSGIRGNGSITPTSSSSVAGPSRLVDTSPTPQRLLGKTLWPKPDDTSRSYQEDPRRSVSADPFNEDSSIQPRAIARRTSSQATVTRSRSLNVRLPSVDLSRNGHGNDRETGHSARTPSMRVGWDKSGSLLPMVNETVGQRMSRWVKEIVVCNFDLERGPVVERRIIGRRWGPGEKQNVAFSSFPDTSLFAEGDIQFSFKIRHIPPDLTLPEPPSPMPQRTISSESTDSANGLKSGTEGRGGNAQEYREWDERGREWLYGYVWFEQKRDGGIARGYMQKSLVILTHLPFPALFISVLHRIAPVFFEHGYSALEAACHAIASWPDPVPDAMLELPMLSEVITVKLPDSDTPQLAPPVGSISRPLLASLPFSSPLRTFAPILPSLWSIWECLILAEPVLVIAPDPKTCSEIVWWLRDLLRPIPPAGDFRPYLHIHDHDFSLLVNSNKPQPGLVVGVTNPFFRNAASHWPNVISIPAPKGRVVAGPKVEQPEGFISRRHRSVQKDRPLLKRLETLVAEGKLDDFEGNSALRTHFQQLTEQMLVPLNRYFQTLVPTISPNPATNSLSSSFSSTNNFPSAETSTSTLKPFSLPSFLNHLKTRGPNPLSFKSKGLSSKTRVETDFYTSFCKSPTFAGWLASRVDSLGLAVAQNQSTGLQNTLKVPGRTEGPMTRGPGHMGELDEFGVRKQGAGVGVGIGVSMGITMGIDTQLTELKLEDASISASTGTRSPTQWSSGVSDQGELRMSSDGSSVGQQWP